MQHSYYLVKIYLIFGYSSLLYNLYATPHFFLLQLYIKITVLMLTFFQTYIVLGEMDQREKQSSCLSI